MKNLLASVAILFAINAPAQIVYPYNPDANGDSAITSGDLLDFLPVFASSFTPQVITIDGLPLDEWLANLEGVVNSNGASIEGLFAMQSQINSLEAANNDLQSQINSLLSELENTSSPSDTSTACIESNFEVCVEYIPDTSTTWEGSTIYHYVEPCRFIELRRYPNASWGGDIGLLSGTFPGQLVTFYGHTSDPYDEQIGPVRINLTGTDQVSWRPMVSEISTVTAIWLGGSWRFYPRP